MLCWHRAWYDCPVWCEGLVFGMQASLWSYRPNIKYAKIPSVWYLSPVWYESPVFRRSTQCLVCLPRGYGTKVLCIVHMLARSIACTPSLQYVCSQCSTYTSPRVMVYRVQYGKFSKLRYVGPVYYMYLAPMYGMYSRPIYHVDPIYRVNLRCERPVYVRLGTIQSDDQQLCCVCVYVVCQLCCLLIVGSFSLGWANIC